MEEISNKNIRYLSRLANHEISVFLNLQQEYSIISDKLHINKITLTIKIFMLVLVFGLINLVISYQASFSNFVIFLSVSLLIEVALIRGIATDVKDIKFLEEITNNLLSYYNLDEYKNKDEKIHSIIENIFKVSGKQLRFELNTQNIDFILYIYNENREKLMLINLKYHTQLVYCSEGYELVDYYDSLDY